MSDTNSALDLVVFILFYFFSRADMKRCKSNLVLLKNNAVFVFIKFRCLAVMFQINKVDHYAFMCLNIILITYCMCASELLLEH